jgi:hypothetical protein
MILIKYLKICIFSPWYYTISIFFSILISILLQLLGKTVSNEKVIFKPQTYSKMNI